MRVHIMLLILGVVAFFPQSANAQENVCSVLVLCSKKTVEEESAGKVFFASEEASEEVQGHADWIVSSKDNQDMPFVILDKKKAKIHVFQKDGQNLGAAPALLSVAVGVEYVSGTGQKKLSEIPYEERTTPAGRFKGATG